MCVFYVVVVAVVVVVVDVDDVDGVDDDEEGEGGRGEGEGEGEEDAQRRKSNNPNLKGGEKLKFQNCIFSPSCLLFWSLVGLNSSGGPVGFISTYPGTCPTPWFRVMFIFVFFKN